MEIKDYVKGLQHIGIPAKNFEESVVFYENLGFEKAWQATDRKCIFLEMKGIMLEVYQSEKPAMAYGAVDHIAIDVENIESLYSVAVSKGLNIVSAGIESRPFWTNGVRFFTIEGPNREKIEFNQYL